MPIRTWPACCWQPCRHHRELPAAQFPWSVLSCIQTGTRWSWPTRADVDAGVSTRVVPAPWRWACTFPVVNCQVQLSSAVVVPAPVYSWQETFKFTWTSGKFCGDWRKDISTCLQQRARQHVERRWYKMYIKLKTTPPVYVYCNVVRLKCVCNAVVSGCPQEDRLLRRFFHDPDQPYFTTSTTLKA